MKRNTLTVVGKFRLKLYRVTLTFDLLNLGRPYHNLLILFLDLEWVGSGAQGAVFSGKLNSQIIAIKKVRELRETDVRHLAKLNNENIVKIL